MEEKTTQAEPTIDIDWKDKYLHLYADFDNYKKRVTKEKEDIKRKTKSDTLDSILDLDNDIHYAVKIIKDQKTLESIKVITNKLSTFLKSQGIEEIQTDSYDEDLHEVVSVVENGKDGIVDVVSKGYKLEGSVIKYPKLIISK